MKLTKTKILLFALVLILLAGGTVGITYARYIQQTDKNGTLTSPEFYFSSDLLTSDNKEYELNAGTTSLSFTLMNYPDALRTSPRDMYVGYTFREKGGASLKTEEDIVLSKNVQSSKTFTVTGLQDGKTYEVVAVGMYKNTKNENVFVTVLSATFTVKKDAKFYAHLDTSESAYVELTIRTTGLGGTATVTFPAGLIPDPFDERPNFVSSVNHQLSPDAKGFYYHSNSFSISMNKNESMKFRFYKENTATVYKFSDFAAKLDGVDAVEFIP
jgi:hypothetical protein